MLNSLSIMIINDNDYMIKHYLLKFIITSKIDHNQKIYLAYAYFYKERGIQFYHLLTLAILYTCPLKYHVLFLNHFPHYSKWL